MECLGSDDVEEEYAKSNLNNKKLIIGLAIIGLIVVVAIFLVPIIFSANYFGVVEIPGLPKGSSQSQVLFIGEPSLGEKVVLDNLAYMLTYRVRDASSFGNTAGEELSQYDIVILDQSLTQKSVSVSLGEAIKKYVEKGGKLIVVLNSGIYSNLSNNVIASDSVGWKANFGNIIPVNCILDSENYPACKEERKINFIGRVRRMDSDHPIMDGVDISPSLDQTPYSLKTLAVQANDGAKTIAYLDYEGTPKTYPAILEKKSLLGGNVIYFNYDPGYTPGILLNTLKYLS